MFIFPAYIEKRKWVVFLLKHNVNFGVGSRVCSGSANVNYNSKADQRRMGA